MSDTRQPDDEQEGFGDKDPDDAVDANDEDDDERERDDSVDENGADGN